MSGSSGSRYVVRRVTPTVDTSAYADGDRVGSIMTFTDILEPVRKGAVVSVTYVFETGTLGANGFSLLLFRSSPTIASADNAALDVSDAQMTANYLGMINTPNTAETSLTVLANNAAASTQGVKLAVDSDDGNLYGVIQAHAAITFTATNDLTVIVGLEQD